MIDLRDVSLDEIFDVAANPRKLNGRRRQILEELLDEPDYEDEDVDEDDEL